MPRHPLRLAPTFLAVVLLVVAPGCGQPRDPGSVVDAVFDAYGGRDLLAGIEAVRLEGTIVTATQGGHGSFIRIVEGPDHLKVLLHYPRHVEIRIVEGDEGWSGGSPQTLAAASGPMLAAMQLQASRSWVPWILDEMRDSLEVERADSAVVVMSGPLRPGLVLRFYVDVHSHHVLRTESDMTTGGMQMEFATDYGDFRTVSGLLVPFREESFASDTHTASLIVDTVLVNPPQQQRKLPLGG
ncbi:MAG: hypothetical protein LJF04_06105 [Gemmatimonadetes bacterium]|nr:hypothetical protein [Gemmatimonadota bacterium]